MDWRIIVNFRQDVGDGMWINAERKASRAGIDRWARWKCRQRNIQSVRIINGMGINQEFWA